MAAVTITAVPPQLPDLILFSDHGMAHALRDQTALFIRAPSAP
ncbi:MAG: hypothetical protein ACOY3E_13845 [Pseudomonadota bacterium]